MVAIALISRACHVLKATSGLIILAKHDEPYKDEFNQSGGHSLYLKVTSNATCCAVGIPIPQIPISLAQKLQVCW